MGRPCRRSLYIMASSSPRIHTDVTNNLDRRPVAQHKFGQFKGVGWLFLLRSTRNRLPRGYSIHQLPIVHDHCSIHEQISHPHARHVGLLKC